MYSVILTELGISIFQDKLLVKAFPFKDPVKEYLEVKDKKASLGEITTFLAANPSGSAVSDKSLLAILKQKSIDSHIMESAEIEEIQETKSKIIIDSKFADNEHDMSKKLRDFAVRVSSTTITKVSQSPGVHIGQSVGALDEIDKIINILSARVREWYGLHFPELENVIDSISAYSHIVSIGRRESLTKEIITDIGFPESKADMIHYVANHSKGGEISDTNLIIVQSIARQVLEFNKTRHKLEEHIESEFKIIAPNLSVILGTTVGARLLAKAGNIKKLASMPASTIQVLGAEKALFRSLKTGAHPPKHGLLFQHPMVHAAPRWQRGKIARAIAAKAVIAARVDAYGEGINNTLLDKLNIRVTEIEEKYSEPTERNSSERTFDRRGDFGKGKRSKQGRHDKRDSKKGRKRKFGRR